MTNYYKLPNTNLYWKIIDETTTVFQVKNDSDAKNISKTTGAIRYNDLIVHVPTFDVVDETEFNAVLNEVLTGINQ